MKKNVRLVLLFALIAVMLVMTAVIASAANVATEAEFKTAVANGGEVNLTADITLSASVTISKDVTINGDGKTLTMGDYKLTVDAGTLTLNNVTMTGTGYILTPTKAGKIVINSGTYTGGVQMATGTSGYTRATLVINGGTFNAIVGKAIVHSNNSKCDVTINGGSFNAFENTYPMFRIADGTHNFFRINGGEFVASGTSEMILKNSINLFTISGGTFTHSGSGAIVKYGNATGALQVAGGTFTHTGEGVAFDLATAVVTVLNNATITAEGNAVVVGEGGSVYVANCDVSSNSGEAYTGNVVVDEAKYFTVNGVAYSWADALNAVANGGTITMTGAPAYELRIHTDKTFTLVGGDDAIAGVKIGGGANVTITNATLSAAVVNYNADLTLKNVTINASTPVTTYGSLTVDGCTMTSGTGGTVIAAAGQPGATLTVVNSTLIGNTSGGCVYIQATYETPVTITNCTLYGYTGVRTNANGGGTINVTGVTYRPFYREDDVQHSGMIVRATADASAVAVFNLTECDIDLTVYHNGMAHTSSGSFAALANNAESEINLINCTGVTNGSDYAYGFNVSNDGAINIIGGTYTYSGSAAVLYISDSYANLSIDGATFINNGTGVMIDKRNAQSVNITGATFTHNGVAEKDLLITNTNRYGALVISNSTMTHTNGGNVIHVESAGTTDSKGNPLTTAYTNILLTDVIATGNITVDALEISAAPSIRLVDVVCTQLIDNADIVEVTTAKVKYFELNGVKYTWEEVMTALRAGDTVKIVGTVDWNIAIETTTAFTLDGNGYTLPAMTFAAGTNVTLVNITIESSANVATLTIESGATVTIDASSAITSNGSYQAIVNRGTCTIDGATITSTASGDAIRNEGTLTVQNNATISNTGTSDAIYSVGGTVTVGVATLSANTGSAMNASGSSTSVNTTATINGATLTAGEGGYAIKVQKGASVTVTYATATGTIATLSSGKGDGYQPVTLTIMDGVFSTGTAAHSTCGNAILFLNTYTNCTINGGKFTNVGTVAPDFASSEAAASSSVVAMNDGTANLVINGGIFSLSGEGSAIYLRNYASCSISDAMILCEGQAAVFAGRSGGSALSISGTTIIGGEVGVWYGVGRDATLTDCTIRNCGTAFRVIRNATALTVNGGMIITGESGAVIAVEKEITPVFDGVTVIDQNPTVTNVFGESAVTLTDCIVLAAAGDEIGAATGVTISATSPSVKYVGTSYKFWMNRAGEADAELDDGASVRVTTDSEGIRFTGSAAVVEGATYGILIAPADYVAAAGAFTKEALDAYAADTGKTAAQVYQMVEAVNSLKIEGETATFSVALINIQSANYGRAFAAVAYVTVGGETTYGDYDSSVNARSLVEVATDAIADVKAEADSVNGYVYATEDGKFSKYTEAERTVLKSYLPV